MTAHSLQVQHSNYFENPLTLSHSGIFSYIVCDLMLASVREVKDIDLPFCFRVSNANIDSIIVQAEGQKDYQSWLKEFRNDIERRLTIGSSHPLLRKIFPVAIIEPRSSVSTVFIFKLDMLITKEGNLIKEK